MIHEIAVIDVAPENHSAFEAAVQRAVAEVLSKAHGFVSFTLTKGVEQENTYTLLIGWETLEDHTVGFREGELFPQWRAMIGEYFAAPPRVDHWTDLFTH
jgi:heme-degrading monooxygenase HmoA